LPERDIGERQVYNLADHIVFFAHPLMGGSIMSSIHHLRSLFAVSGMVLAVAYSAHAADPFTLTSTTFKDGQMMPRKVANSLANNPNCVGQNVSPQLSWTGVPDGTKSFAILMVDPEGRGGAGVNHWVAYGIPASVTSFAEGEVSKASDKYVGGKSTQGVGNFSGPCTPPGTPHHYTFVVVATDMDPKELPPGLTREELMAKIVPPAPTPSHAKGTAGLVGLFVKPN
jgi:Raf kinase inhibitor-like YbhB/YbcL family protein